LIGVGYVVASVSVGINLKIIIPADL